MKEFMTMEDLDQMEFYQMPKAFFYNPEYMPMSCDAKLVYMLMGNLVPLSIKNNWVNEDNEVFIRFSRSDLMTALNIKGTQKAARIMKELVDYKLIAYQKVNVTKRSEIFLYQVTDLDVVPDPYEEEILP